MAISNPDQAGFQSSLTTLLYSTCPSLIRRSSIPHSPPPPPPFSVNSFSINDPQTLELKTLTLMESLGVLLTFPMNAYLESELAKRCNLFRLWESPPESRSDFIRSHAQSIRAVVGNATVGADADTIDALPKLEIVASFSVGLDKVDLGKCKERGIRVTNTPDVLTEDVADLAIGLALSVMRRISDADRYVRSGGWKSKGDYKLTTKV